MSKLNGKLIVLDPGHGEVKNGNSDPGAVNSALGLNERDQVRRQADLVRQQLEAVGARVHIVENGTDKTLREIGAEGRGSACFISLHLNAFNKQAQGHLVLIDTQGTDDDERLANLINRELDERLEIPNHGVKKQALGVLKGVPLPTPAVLVESFFIDSASSKQNVDEWIRKSADGISVGVQKYFAS